MGRKVYEWYSRLSPWYQAALVSLYFAVGLSVTFGLAFGSLDVVFFGAFLGLILGLASYYRERRDEARSDEITDYPEDLEAVERGHDKQWVILSPAFLVTAIPISWFIFGTGVYGLIFAFPATALASWALGRFGGPNDPKWKKVRNEWKRKHSASRGG